MSNESNLAAAPEISDLQHVKFEVFRLEQEERQLQFIAGAHRAQAEKMEKKGKRALASAHVAHQQKLLLELKSIRADLAEMKNQLDDMTDD